MGFLVYSRPAIKARAPDDVPHIIISVTTDGDSARFRTNEHTKGILRLKFHDLEVVVGTLVTEEDLFSDEQAKEVVHFFNLHKDSVERIVIHCDAGLSRSPAIAAALSGIHLGDDGVWFKTKRPNSRVYRRVLDAYYGTYE